MSRRHLSFHLLGAIGAIAFGGAVAACRSGAGEANAAVATSKNSSESAASEQADGRPRVSPGLPREIVAWGEDVRRACTADGGRVTGAPRAAASADFNSDGRPDYVVGAADSYECSLGAGYYLAGQVPEWVFFISGPNGYRAVGDPVTALGVEIGRRAGRDVAMVSAGGPGAYDRPFDRYAYGWNGRAMAPLAYFAADGREVNQDGSARGGGAGWTRSGFPNLQPGFYSTRCWPPSPDGSGYIHLTEQMWQEADAAHPITRIERNGPVRYRFHTTVEDEEGNASPDTIQIQVRDFTSFVELVDGREGRDFAHCADREVPPAVRRSMTGR